MPPNTIYVGRGSLYGNPFPVEKYGLDKALSLFEGMIQFFFDDEIEKLRGKDLACWCRLDQKCHADILLRLANK